MRTPPNEFEEYLAPGESVTVGNSGTLSNGSYRAEGAIGVTDRRVLFVANGDGFFDVEHDAVHSIRSQPAATFSYREMGPEILAVLGASVAVAAFVGVLLLEPSVLAFVLALLTVGGVATAEGVRRRGAEIEWVTLEDARNALVERVEDVERLRPTLERLRESVERLRATLDGSGEGSDDLLVLGIASVALVALIGLITVTESLLVVPLALVAVGGLGVAEYTYRRLQDRDDVRSGRGRAHEVSLLLVDGHVVHLQVDAGQRFDRDLSALVRRQPVQETPAELSRP